MRTTKSQILANLKRNGHRSIEELATAIGVAKMTVRQHLATLERDGLVESREVRRPTGRPHLAFSLTDQGEEMFPKRYDRLAGLLLDEVSRLDGQEIVGLSPEAKKRLLFERMAARLQAQYEGRVAGKQLPERVAAVAQMLDEEGGFAEWRSVSGGYEITDYNCVYRRVAEADSDLCDWHLTLLNGLLGSDVRCSQFMAKGAQSCRFIVRDGGAPAAKTQAKTGKEGS
jgi:predicted ArsR family transcriptional regulator